MLASTINWTEKSLALIKTTLGFSRQMKYEAVLENAIFETNSLAESSEILLFSIDDSNHISILSSNESGDLGNLLNSEILNDFFYSKSIQIKRLTSEDNLNADIFTNTSSILAVPLYEEFFQGMMVLVFDDLPLDTKGLLEFGEIVQNLFLQIFYHEFLKSGQIKIRKGTVESEKIISKIKIKKLSGLDKSGVQFQSFSVYDHISGQSSKKKNVTPSESISSNSDRPLDSNEIQTDTSGSKKETSIKALLGSNNHQKDFLFHGISKNLPVIFLRIGDNGILLDIGGKGLEKLKLRENQALGFSIHEIIPQLDFSQLFFEKSKVKKLILKKTIAEKLVVFDFKFFPLENNPGELIGFGIDISDQYLLEKKLKRAKKLSEKARLAKSFFLAKQSHEIRTFIHSILGFAQLIKNNRKPEDSEEYLDFIISSGEILLNILGNILDLTKIEEGKLELVEEPFNFMEAMNACLIPSQIQAKEKGLKFTVNFDKEFPKYFIGDGVKLIQILMNLVSNSIKFTEKGGINISFYCLSIPVEGEKIKIGITVSDTGIGISQNRQKKIFGDFSQADNSIHRRFGGSGLGLSIVKELVNLMEGEIEVRSPGDISSDVGGVGSTFSLNVNLHVTYPPSSESENDAEKNDVKFYGVLKVLLADDNYLNQRLASTILENLGCEVTIANNGQEALLELTKNDFHLIFMDVQMPVLDGYQTTITIRENLNLNLPIIGLSANVYKEDIDLCYESGMDDYLGRPYTIKNFEEKVFKWAPQIEPYEDLVLVDDNDNNHNNFGKLVDLDYLKRVFNSDLELMNDLVQSFLIQHQVMISDLNNAITLKDYKLVASLAHDMRSSLQTIGLNSLIQILIDIEINAKKVKNDSELERLFFLVKETSEAASLELEKFLSN